MINLMVMIIIFNILIILTNIMIKSTEAHRHCHRLPCQRCGTFHLTIITTITTIITIITIVTIVNAGLPKVDKLRDWSEAGARGSKGALVEVGQLM